MNTAIKDINMVNTIPAWGNVLKALRDDVTGAISHCNYIAGLALEAREHLYPDRFDFWYPQVHKEMERVIYCYELLVSVRQYLGYSTAKNNVQQQQVNKIREGLNLYYQDSERFKEQLRSFIV
jgi:hypothetical protein